MAKRNSTKKTEKKPEPGSVRLKNINQELFCMLYTGYHTRDLFGNGTRSYIAAYNADEINRLNKEIEQLTVDKEEGYTRIVRAREARIKQIETSARVYASILLSKGPVRERVDYLLTKLMDDNFMDRELTYTAAQRFDLASKVAAIREYNRLKDRGGVGKLEGTFTFSWEGDEETGPVKKKPVVKKVELKQQGDVEWSDE